MALVGLVVGVPVGSWLNLVIDRVPDRLPLRGARADEPCPPLRWPCVDVQPWLSRRGRGTLGEALPGRWLAVELATASAFAAVGARYGDSLTLAPLWVLAACLVAVSTVDLQVLRIPDRITFPTLGASTAMIVVISLARGEGSALGSALFGTVLYFVLLVVPHLVYPRGMGFGDVKLALVMGLHLGWLGWVSGEGLTGPARLVLYALMLGSLLGALFGIVVAVASRRRGAFPFGPALALACLGVCLFAPELRI